MALLKAFIIMDGTLHMICLDKPYTFNHCSTSGLFPLQELRGNVTGPCTLVCVSIAGTSPEDDLLELLQGQNKSLPRGMYSVWPLKIPGWGLRLTLC